MLEFQFFFLLLSFYGKFKLRKMKNVNGKILRFKSLLLTEGTSLKSIISLLIQTKFIFELTE